MIPLRKVTLLLRNMTVLYPFNRFQHCAINKDEKHKPMTRTDREAQAQHNDTTQETELNFLRKIFANVKNASNDSFIAQYDSIIRDLIVFNIAQ